MMGKLIGLGVPLVFIGYSIVHLYHGEWLALIPLIMGFYFFVIFFRAIVLKRYD